MERCWLLPLLHFFTNYWILPLLSMDLSLLPSLLPHSYVPSNSDLTELPKSRCITLENPPTCHLPGVWTTCPPYRAHESGWRKRAARPPATTPPSPLPVPTFQTPTRRRSPPRWRATSIHQQPTTASKQGMVQAGSHRFLSIFSRLFPLLNILSPRPSWTRLTSAASPPSPRPSLSSLPSPSSPTLGLAQRGRKGEDCRTKLWGETGSRRHSCEMGTRKMKGRRRGWKASVRVKPNNPLLPKLSHIYLFSRVLERHTEGGESQKPWSPLPTKGRGESQGMQCAWPCLYPNKNHIKPPCTGWEQGDGGHQRSERERIIREWRQSFRKSRTTRRRLLFLVQFILPPTFQAVAESRVKRDGRPTLVKQKHSIQVSHNRPTYFTVNWLDLEKLRIKFMLFLEQK